MLRFILFLLLSFIAQFSFSQNENNIWYFGKNAGLDFSSGVPVPLLNGALNTWEGCASVADKTTGALLFYTNGVTVWNKNHAVMTNGTGLWGDMSSAQSAAIVPKPGSDSLYYIFTVDAGTSGFPNGGVMAYSIVDMSLSAGNGSVTVKNVSLFSVTTEKLTAALHSSGCSIWVIAHQWMTNAFYAYLVTDSSISAPVITNIGSIHNCAVYGQMKVSSNGSKLAITLPCFSGSNIVELFDFDNTTGIVSNPIQLQQDHLVYGLEFSPSGQFLYVADHNNSAAIMYKQVAQYDVTLGSAAAISASRIIVGAVHNSTAFFGGSAQLAPDGKIYVVPVDADSLSVINYPDSAGLACNFVVHGFYLGGKLNDHGLPGKVITASASCSPVPVVAFASSDSMFCEKHCIDFYDMSLNNPVQWQWYFPGAQPDTSTLQNPTLICYNNYGTYPVTLVAWNAFGGDSVTITSFITVYQDPPPPVISVSTDTLFCSSPVAVSWQWYLNNSPISGANDSFYVFTQQGDYYCLITDSNGCQSASNLLSTSVIEYSFDELNFFVHPNPVNGELFIEFIKLSAISVFDCLGRTVYSQMNPESTLLINTGSWLNGIYILKLSSGSKELKFKLIVNHP